MLFLRRHLQLLTWIALVAILALAVLPSVSRALSFVRGDSSFAEVCTPQGARLVALMEQEGSGQQPAAHGLHLEHCPLCSLSFDAPLLPAVQVNSTLLFASAAPPALFLQAPRTLFAWHSVQARGPPATS